jgi:adenine-specific DNA-methyltransferase
LVEKTQRNSDQVDVTYVEGAKIPFNFNSISEINSGFVSKKIDAKTLRNASKWDYLIRRGDIQEIPGFVNLSQLACTKRGIATGANDFFHLSSERVRQLGISDKNLISCIGQARDVRGLSFTKKDFASLCNEGKRTKLVSFSGSINGREAAYIAHGENLNLHRRYLLSKRNPWYSMEVRPPSPIWAAVFGRKELRFILNEALVANLTTFHSVYPHDTSPSFCKALTVCLNSRLVQEMAQSNMRVYGGGC